MTSIDKDRLAWTLPSLALPGVGIIAGTALIILSFVDWPVKPQMAKREILNLGFLCLVLGVINLAIVWYVMSL